MQILTLVKVGEKPVQVFSVDTHGWFANGWKLEGEDTQIQHPLELPQDSQPEQLKPIKTRKVKNGQSSNQ